MEYHFSCPITGKVLSFSTLTDARAYLYAAYQRLGASSTKRTEIRSSNGIMGTVFRSGFLVLYKQRNHNKPYVLASDGSCIRTFVPGA